MSDTLRTIAEERVNAKIRFYRNFTSYIVVNAFLAVINYMFTPEFWWVLFPVFFWGIGVFVDFVKAFVIFDRFDSESYRENKIQDEMEKLRN